MSYNVPGVHIEEVSTLPPSVVSVGTAVPAFIGHTALHSGAAPIVRKINSFLDYKTYFGGPQGHVQVSSTGSITVGALVYRMYYALQHYFMNGGGACYIVSVGNHASGGHPKDGVSDGLDALDSYDEPTIYVLADDIGKDSVADYNSLLAIAIGKCANLGDRIVLADCDPAQLELWRQGDPLGAISVRGVAMGHAASYCAAYAPFVETTMAPADVSYASFTGNSQLLHAVKAQVASLRITLPPTPAVAAAMVTNDATRGVHHAPANINLVGVTRPVMTFTESQLESLNVDATNGNSVNAIRSFTGRGTLIYGARTMYSNSNEWRYVSVRRFYNMVEESVKKATMEFVFAPNTPETWQALKTMVGNYLDTLWSDGALMGATSRDAYFVRVGRGETMTDQDILDGKLIVRIGMAVGRPAEFIVLQFTHFLPQA